MKSDANFLLDVYDTNEEIGWIKHAFVLSFYYLLRFCQIIDSKLDDVGTMQAFYKKALRETIQLGGDTDTNACIVGGMVGALVGI